MSFDYIVFDAYDPNASREILVKDYITNSLKRYETILKFIQTAQLDIYDGFVKMFLDRISQPISASEIEGLVELINALQDMYPNLMETGLLESLIVYTFQLLNLPEDLVRLDMSATALLVNIEKGENLPHYQAIETLVDLLGRDDGLRFYKKFVEHINSPPPAREVESFQAFRKDAVEGMGNSGGFRFSIYDFDESMWIGRFDKCVVYDSLKDQKDPEIGYLATCYGGIEGCNKRDWCIRMRRTQTLFSADYCDELYWDRHVHDDPEQPPLEFTEKMKIK